MNYYQREMIRIKRLCYANDHQLAAVRTVRRLLGADFDQPLNLDRLSGACFISKFHLIRLFKKYYGLTIKQYLTIKRLEAAKQLLADGSTVREACFRAGFDSPSSFSTRFKEKTGMAPREFRKKAISATFAETSCCILRAVKNSNKL